MKTHAGETDHALIVDIPLLIAQQAAAGLGNGFEERVNRGGTAPFQIVMIFLNQIPEAARVAGFHATDTSSIAEGDLFHLAMFGSGGKRVAITAAHVRHVDAEDPQEAIAFARRDLAERA